MGKHNKTEDLAAKAYEFDLEDTRYTARAAVNQPTQDQRIETLKASVSEHRRKHGTKP